MISNCIVVFFPLTFQSHLFSHNTDLCPSLMKTVSFFPHFSLSLYLPLFFFTELFSPWGIAYWFIYICCIFIFPLKYKLYEEQLFVFPHTSSCILNALKSAWHIEATQKQLLKRWMKGWRDQIHLSCLFIN